MTKPTRFLILLFLALAPSGVYAQKVKITDGVASVDKVDVCKIKDDQVRRLSFSLFTLQGEEELYFKWIEYGQFGYFEVYDAENLDDVLFETDAITGYRKWIVKQLYSAEVISADGVDEKQLQVFAKKMGKEHTRLREERRP